MNEPDPLKLILDKLTGIEDRLANLEADADETESLAREARKRLAADTGVPGPVPEDIETTAVELGTGLEVQLPTPSEEAKATWQRTAQVVMENIDVSKWGMNVEAAIDAYSKGGPLWLAASGTVAHDHLMSLPRPMRIEMAQSVSTYAPKDAAEFARDALRYDAEASRETAYDTALDDADQRPTAHR